MKTKPLNILQIMLTFFIISSCTDNKDLTKEVINNNDLIKTNNSLINNLIENKPVKKEFILNLFESANYNKERPLEVLLPIDCSDERLQAFHLDLVNQFGVIGTINLNKEKTEIDSIKLRIQEIRGNSRYDLLSAKYLTTNRDNSGNKVHNIRLNIENGNQRNGDVKIDLGTLTMMKKGDKIDFHIVSKNPDIRSKNIKTLDNFVTKFGNNFCRGIIVAP